MIQLGLSSMDTLWMALITIFSFFFVVTGMSVKPEHRVTYMNTGWATPENREKQPAGNFLVSFSA